MTVTGKAISAAIHKATGLHVMVGKAEGQCYFYSDDNRTGLWLETGRSTSVYVSALCHLTVSQWVEEFEHIIAELEPIETAVTPAMMAEAERLDNERNQ